MLDQIHIQLFSALLHKLQHPVSIRTSGAATMLVHLTVYRKMYLCLPLLMRLVIPNAHSDYLPGSAGADGSVVAAEDAKPLPATVCRSVSTHESSLAGEAC